jgi:hypothetical protein
VRRNTASGGLICLLLLFLSASKKLPSGTAIN